MDPKSAQAGEARTRLDTERERLEGLLHKLEHEYDEDGPIDPLGGDAGADTTSAATYLGMRDDLGRQVDEVDAALKRVDEGTYGIDEVTGGPIDPARLEVQPTARTNV
jgi:RNA polymerase-binding transcription factor DksA